MNRTRRALLASLLVALAAAVGYALAGVPNVELVTVIVFVSGFLLGPKLGAAVGAASWAIHSLFNPMGVALPPVLAAQVAGGAVIGAVGGVLGPRLLVVPAAWAAALAAGAAGLLLTLVYQVLVNVAAFYSFVDDRATDALWKFVLAGLAFTAMHLVWNTAAFLVILRPLLSVLDRYRQELE